MARAGASDAGAAAVDKPGGDVSCGLTPETCSPQEPWGRSETPGDVSWPLPMRCLHSHDLRRGSVGMVMVEHVLLLLAFICFVFPALPAQANTSFLYSNNSTSMGSRLKHGKQPLCFFSSCTLLNFDGSDDLFQTWVSSSLVSRAAWLSPEQWPGASVPAAVCAGGGGTSQPLFAAVLRCLAADAYKLIYLIIFYKGCSYFY